MLTGVIKHDPATGRASVEYTFTSADFAISDLGTLLDLFNDPRFHEIKRIIQHRRETEMMKKIRRMARYARYDTT